MSSVQLRPIARVNFLNFSDAFKKFETFSKKETEEIYSKTCKLMKRNDYFINPPKRVQLSTGEERVKKFEDILYNGYDIPLNRFQREWSVMCVQALLPLIMGEEDWLKTGPNVLKRRKWKIPKKIVVAITTRRIGKTYFKIRLIVTVAKVRPGLRIAVAATGQRISTEAKITAKSLCVQLGLKIIKDNEENLWIEDENFPNNENKATKIGFYPSNPEIDLHTYYIFYNIVIIYKYQRYILYIFIHRFHVLYCFLTNLPKSRTQKTCFFFSSFLLPPSSPLLSSHNHIKKKIISDKTNQKLSKFLYFYFVYLFYLF